MDGHPRVHQRPISRQSRQTGGILTHESVTAEFVRNLGVAKGDRALASSQHRPRPAHCSSMDDQLPRARRRTSPRSAFLDGLRDRPVWPRASYAEMLDAFGGDLPVEGADPEAVVDELVRLAEPGLLACAGPRFFGFVFGATLPAALATDWLVSAWDQNAGLTEPTPAAAAVETVAGGWLTDLLGLPSGSAVGFVTGAMMANFTCLAAARR